MALTGRTNDLGRNPRIGEDIAGVILVILALAGIGASQFTNLI